ncbi:TetR/AcrR family transcriptional regulator [Actinomadura barringtoniae]|uniref:TetR/AcrR family transcriptional regulator n=1 Tax=Actinomadura barringtoniae TaxID=1427535 RepID=A0A939TBC6_9ACTN|nr:TetR/AcrR family transcriptional regulator [Actinomadura barringtoniae]MBO2453412.1 TetR/AcrR family transcriptional regulator [Actinomadura barringtoniae]
MDKSSGQGNRPTSAEQGEATRAAILKAAAALIGENGWGHVTTRAIAARAGVPHGAVSYHFRGKDDLLRQAAVAATVEALAVPIAMVRSAGSVREVLEGTMAWYASGALDDPSMALLLETARQSSRDEELREPFAEVLRTYRAALSDLVRADQERGDLGAGASPEGIAMAVAALLDGLMLHLVADPGLDAQEGVRAVLDLMGGQS